MTKGIRRGGSGLLWAAAQGKLGSHLAQPPLACRPLTGSCPITSFLCLLLVSSCRLYKAGLRGSQQRNQIYSACLQIFSTEAGGGGRAFLAHSSCSFHNHKDGLSTSCPGLLYGPRTGLPQRASTQRLGNSLPYSHGDTRARGNPEEPSSGQHPGTASLPGPGTSSGCPLIQRRMWPCRGGFKPCTY